MENNLLAILLRYNTLLALILIFFLDNTLAMARDGNLSSKSNLYGESINIDKKVNTLKGHIKNSYRTDFSNLNFKNKQSALGKVINEPKWVLHSTIDGVSFYYKISTCQELSVIYLRISNRNQQEVKVRWDEEFWTSQFHVHENPEGSKELAISPNQEVTNGCGENGALQCAIPISKIVSIPNESFLKFDFRNIEIVKIY
jgi:hypothetical protein